MAHVVIVFHKADLNPTPIKNDGLFYINALASGPTFPYYLEPRCQRNLMYIRNEGKIDEKLKLGRKQTAKEGPERKPVKKITTESAL